MANEVVTIEKLDEFKEYSENKSYDASKFSGLGMRTLKKNVQTVSGTQKNVLTQAVFKDANNNLLENIVYVIKYDFDLNGSTIEIGSNCVLKFDGGSLSNGTLAGNNTVIDGENTGMFGNNIILSGTWIKKDVGHLKWFASASSYNQIVKNLNLIANDLDLDDLTIDIEKESLYVDFGRIFSNKTATINFKNTTSSDVSGLVFTSRNLKIYNINFTEDFSSANFPQNDFASGTALAVYDSNVTANDFEYKLAVSNCKFTGSYSSSCLSSSFVSEALIENCVFDGVSCADHIIYFSTKISKMEIKNTKIVDSTCRNSKIKMRSATNAVLVLDGIYCTNTNSYLTEFDNAYGITDVILNNIIYTAGTNQGGLLYYGSSDVNSLFNFNLNNVTWKQTSATNYIIAKATTETYHKVGSCILTDCTLENTRIQIEGDVNTASFKRCILKNPKAGTFAAKSFSFDDVIVSDPAINSGALLTFTKIEKIDINKFTIGSGTLASLLTYADIQNIVSICVNNSNLGPLLILLFNVTVATSLAMNNVYAPSLSYDVNYKGNIINMKYGSSTATRPKSISETNGFLSPQKDVGFMYFDGTKPIWWNGTNWVDATGTVVS